MKNKIEYILFLTFSRFFCLLGLNNARKFAWVMAVIFFYFIPIRKKIVIENLALAFPELADARIKEIAFNSYKSFAITLIEILCMPCMSRDDIISQVNCTNDELILNKYKEGNGVILLSAHFGNWEYIAASVSAKLKTPFHVIVKSQRNNYVSDWMNRMRTKWENKVVPLGISIRDIYKELKDKNIIAMVADQRGPIEGIRVNFLGRKSAIYSGPALLALKTNAPILMSITVRQPGFTYLADVHEISRANLPDDPEEKVIELSQRHFNLLESYIRKYPEQWLWMHKRWKY